MEHELRTSQDDYGLGWSPKVMLKDRNLGIEVWVVQMAVDPGVSRRRHQSFQSQVVEQAHSGNIVAPGC